MFITIAIFKTRTDLLTRTHATMSSQSQTSDNPSETIFALSHPDAVVPTRANPDDVGLDLTLVAVDRTVGRRSTDRRVLWFQTGVHIKPAPGIYYEVHLRSSASKTPWTIANGTGIIDPGYRGEILVALRHNGNEEAFCDFELPWKLCQLVPRRVVREPAPPRVVDMETFRARYGKTQRGEGGYGSTDAAKNTDANTATPAEK